MENPSISCSSLVVHDFNWLVLSLLTKERGIKCCSVDISSEQSNIMLTPLNWRTRHGAELVLPKEYNFILCLDFSKVCLKTRTTVSVRHFGFQFAAAELKG